MCVNVVSSAVPEILQKIITWVEASWSEKKKNAGFGNDHPFPGNTQRS